MKGTKNTLYLSEKVSLKPKQLHYIDNEIDKCLSGVARGLNVEYKKPTIVIATLEEVSHGNTAVFASYSAAENILYVANITENTGLIRRLQEGFVASDNELSTIYHELFHWSDAQEYIAKYGAIVDQREYIRIIQPSFKKKVDALRKRGYNLDEISKYASDKLREGRYDEVYTEYRVKKLLGGM